MLLQSLHGESAAGNRFLQKNREAAGGKNLRLQRSSRVPGRGFRTIADTDADETAGHVKEC